MALINVPNINNNDAATPDLFNSRFGTIVNAINGNLDNTNIATGGVAANNLAASSVTNGKIADGSVTAAKLAFGGSGTGVWWQEIGRTTLTATGDTISVSITPTRKYLRLIFVLIATGGTIGGNYTYNNDSATNYVHVFAQDGAGDTGGFTQTSHPWDPAPAGAVTVYCEFDVFNFTAQEKITYGFSSSSGAVGSGQVGSRRDWHNKWSNVAAQISSVTVNNTGTGDFAIGSEVIVLGHD